MSSIIHKTFFLLLFFIFHGYTQVNFQFQFEFSKADSSDELSRLQLFDFNDDGNDEIIAGFRNDSVWRLMVIDQQGTTIFTDSVQNVDNDNFGKFYLFERDSLKFLAASFFVFKPDTEILKINIYSLPDFIIVATDTHMTINSNPLIDLYEPKATEILVYKEGNLHKIHIGFERSWTEYCSIPTLGGDHYKKTYLYSYDFDGNILSYIGFTQLTGLGVYHSSQLNTTGRYYDSDFWISGEQQTNRFDLRRIILQNPPVAERIYYITGWFTASAWDPGTYNNYPLYFGVSAYNDTSAVIYYQTVNGSNSNFINHLNFRSISLDSGQVLWSRQFQVNWGDRVYSSIDVSVNLENYYFMYFRTDTLEIMNQLTGEVILKQPSNFTPFYILKDNGGERFFIESFENFYKIYKLDSIILGIKEDRVEFPKLEALVYNYPNPFNAQTTIIFKLHKPIFIELKIFNILGEKLETLLRNRMLAGTHRVIWNTEDYASGVYLYQLNVGRNQFITKKMVLIK